MQRLAGSQGSSRLPRLAAEKLLGMSTFSPQQVMSEVLEAPMVGQVVA